MATEPKFADANDSLTIDLQETVKFKGSTYAFKAATCSETCSMIMCPCRPWVKYIGPEDKELRFSNACTLCCQDWTAEINGEKVGRTTTPGCCENGIVFALCSFCKCSGNITLQKFYDENDQEQYTIRKSMFCCWKLAGLCAACGACASCCVDAKAFCGDKNHVVMQEDIYGPMSEKDKVSRGHVSIVNRIECLGCCPVRVPVRYSVTIDKDHIEAAGAEDLITLGLLPLIYRGVPVPCKCCAMAPVPAPTGVSCLDAGRDITTKHMTQEEMMNLTYGGSPAELEMSR